MVISLVDLTGNVADLVGSANLDNDTSRPNRRVKAWLTSNAPGDYIADLDNNVLRLASVEHDATDGKRAIEADGSFEFADIIATGSADTNLDDSGNLQYTLHIDAPSQDPAKRGKREVLTFGPYSVTATANVATLVAEQELTATYASAFMDQAQALLDAQILISGIDDTDSAVAALIEDELVGPLTTAALSASYAGVEDTEGNPVTTWRARIVVNTATGEIDDIITEAV